MKTINKKICINCKRPYKTTGKMFCSLSCRDEYKNKNSNSHIKIKCSFCNKEFSLSKSKYKRKIKTQKALFCSRKCNTESQKVKKPIEQLQRKEMICLYCNKPFFVKPHLTKTRKYCSPKCSSEHKKNRLIIKCKQCNKEFEVNKGVFRYKKKCGIKNLFCSNICQSKYQETGVNDLLDCVCSYCNTPIKRQRRLLELTNTHFCNRHCQGNYYSKYLGRDNRSLLEKKIESYLIDDYPKLDIIFGDRQQCYTLELDIYIPELNLAFEINGPIHYKPIYGNNALDKIQKNDAKKIKICKTKGIKLIIIDDVLDYYNDNSEYIYSNKIKPIIDNQILKSNIQNIHKPTLGVINCAATKKTFKCRASEMYDNSRLFRTMRDYCIRNYDEYVILSAYYGVLYPDAVIEPYKDTVMFVPNDLLHSGKEYHALTTAEKKQWAKNVVDDIDWDKYTEINFHCGGYYIEHILPLLEERKIQKKESIIVHSMKKGISNTINNYKE
jgi:hypothetical protein